MEIINENNEVIYEEGETAKEKTSDEILESELLEDIRIKRAGGKTKITDIITMQCIMCILLAIVFLVVNIIIPKMAEEVVVGYKDLSIKEEKINEVIAIAAQKISEFMNSTPYAGV